ncbi:alpha/beta hydrolase [Fibrella sp. HMF5335]|uniref:Alpha/beta hydrolase n=1 Tax=Fibrella rubiginis TaxID=2817060 RepID=A0A939K6B4_9BACT|nr:alpha/beta hydrolase [Fibrella rubiginis]MBO0938663.1 alpha/beta hydrolase [Fibrella rubiginis]
MHIRPGYLFAFVLICLLICRTTSSTLALSFTSHRTRNIPYLPATAPGFDPVRHLLDVYSPNRDKATTKPVVVFIHGGNWNSGNKNIYWFIGRRLAKQGVVAVVINYRLAPNVQVPAMSNDCARAVQWISQHIADYGGDPNRIYVMGHSAGGGLAALLATDDALFTTLGMPKNPVKGAILDDPAGIDMYDFLKETKNPADKQYLVSFGTDPEGWRAASPLFKVRAGLPPMLLFAGGETYPSIAAGTKAFHEKLDAVGVMNKYQVLPGKKHVPMVKQLFWKHNIIYRDLLTLVKG